MSWYAMITMTWATAKAIKMDTHAIWHSGGRNDGSDTRYDPFEMTWIRHKWNDCFTETLKQRAKYISWEFINAYKSLEYEEESLTWQQKKHSLLRDLGIVIMRHSALFLSCWCYIHQSIAYEQMDHNSTFHYHVWNELEFLASNVFWWILCCSMNIKALRVISTCLERRKLLVILRRNGE